MVPLGGRWAWGVWWLAASAVAASLFASAWPVLAAEGDDTTVLVVPMGRSGDVLVYTRFEGEPLGPWVSVGREGAESGEAMVIGDGSGTPRVALPLRVLPYDGNKDLRTTYYLDAANGEVFRVTNEYSEPNLRWERWTNFGGLGDESPNRSDAGEPIDIHKRVQDVEAWTHQGRTYRPGEDVSEELRARYEGTWSLGRDGVSLETLSAQVGAWGAVEGAKALPLHVRGEVRFDVAALDDHDHDGFAPLLAAKVPLQGTVAWERDVWLTASSPYPVAIVDRYTGALPGRVMLARPTLAPGDAPLGTPAQVPEPTTPERAASEDLYPTEGAAPGCMLTDQALAAAASHPKHADLRTWLQLHPGAHPVGMVVTCVAWPPGVTPAPRSNMQIVFGVPGEQEVFAMSHGEPDDVGSWDTEVTGRVFSEGPALVDVPVEGLSESPLTWSGARDLWSRALSEDLAGLEPNYALWAGRVTSRVPALIEPEFAVIGWINFSPPLGVGDGGIYLQFNIRTGQVHHYSEHGTTGTGSPGPGTLEGTGAPLPAPEVQGSPGSAPTVERGTLVVRTAVLGAAGAGLLVLLAPPVLHRLAFFLGGFARIAPGRLLEHPSRRAMHDLIQAEPGIDPPTVASRLGFAWSTANHHLRILERGGIVSKVRDGRHMRLFPAVGIAPKERSALAVLRNESTRRVLELVQASPGVDRRALAKRLGVTPPAVAWHLARLERVGLVTRAPEGRRIVYVAVPEAPTPTA